MVNRIPASVASRGARDGTVPEVRAPVAPSGVAVQELTSDQFAPEEDGTCLAPPSASHDRTPLDPPARTTTLKAFAQRDQRHTLQGNLFRRPIRPSDVVQASQLGNCYFAAMMSSLAAVDPNAIRRMVRQNEDGSFTVRFFRPDGEGRLRPHEVRVDRDVPTSARGPRQIFVGATSQVDNRTSVDNAAQNIWYPIIEKAWAQMLGGYDELEHSNGRYAHDMITMITGVRAELITIGAQPLDAIVSQIIDRLDARRPVTLGTGDMATRHPERFITDERSELLPPGARPNFMVGHHAYSVLSHRRDETTGEVLLTIRNPFGDWEPGNEHGDGVFEMPASWLPLYFDNVNL